MGETALAFYRATNTTDRPIRAVPTSTCCPRRPHSFHKLECFCFKEQTLAPGESVDMPVSFYIDPQMARDQDLDGVST